MSDHDALEQLLDSMGFESVPGEAEERNEAPPETKTVEDFSGTIMWDIETGPRSKKNLDKFFVPPELPDDPPPFADFDEAAVKYGRAKKPETKERILAEKKAKHLADKEAYEKKTANWPKEKKRILAEAFESFIEDAALSPITGRVCAIGYYYPGQKDPYRIDQAGPGDNTDHEAAVLAGLWSQCNAVRIKRGSKMIGFNSNGWDLPFCIRRSWAHSIKVPDWIYEQKGRWTNLAPMFVDLLQIWKLGEQWYKSPVEGIKHNLDTICKFMGVGRKTPGISGKDFHRLYLTEPEKAMKYLRTDLDLTHGLALALGVVGG